MSEVKKNKTSPPTKCRGQYEDLNKDQQRAVEERCNDEKFSSARFLLSSRHLELKWPNIKEHFPPNVNLDQVKQMFCSLGNVIHADRVCMPQFGMTFTQLGDALKTIMRLAVHKGDVVFSSPMAYMAKATGQPVNNPKFETPFMSLIQGDPQWCDQGRFESCFTFNDQPLRVFVVLWGGAQRCPFQPPEDTHYHGYHYGARDVIVTNLKNNKTLVYSTLLPHMIKHHGFLEGPFCRYRITLETVVQVLGKFEEGKSYRLASIKKLELCSADKPDAGHRAQSQGNHIVFCRDHTLFRAPNGQIHASPMDNTATVTLEQHQQRLREIGLTPDQLKKGQLQSFAQKEIKVYNWSEWLPGMKDGPLSEAAQIASGPFVMMVGGSGV